MRYDIDTFAGEDLVQDTNAEIWLRTVQTTLRGDQQAMRAIGLYYHHHKHRFLWDWG